MKYLVNFGDDVFREISFEKFQEIVNEWTCGYLFVGSLSLEEMYLYWKDEEEDE